MRTSNHKMLIALFTTFLALLLTTIVMGTSTAKLNLAQLVAKSGRIFVGKCISISEGTVPGPGGGQIPYIGYTFAVSKSVKGGVGETIILRQVGQRQPDFSKGYYFSVPGMPSYKVGEEFVLLLTQESQLGLTVPVGMAQGSFKIFLDQRTGQKKVVNGLVNAGLFEKMESGKTPRFNVKEMKLLSQKKGAIEYDSFISLLEKIVR